MSDDDWDTVDIDARIEQDEKARKKAEDQENKNIWKNLKSGDNITSLSDQASHLNFDDRSRNQKKSKKHGSLEEDTLDDDYIQSFPYKDIVKLRSYTEDDSKLPQLFLEIFGEFERFMETHRHQLSGEIIVDLLIIDAALLELPFRCHIEMLLDELMKVCEFWDEMKKFIEDFFKNKSSDKTFLLKIDMKGFFRNIQVLLKNLMMENRFNEKIESSFNEIITIMENYPENVWNCSEEIKSLQKLCRENQDEFEIYNIFPTLEDLKKEKVKEKKKKTKEKEQDEGLKDEKYESVQHYLKINLPLLKEDLIVSLRKFLKHIETFDFINDNAWQFPDFIVYPEVEIKISDVTMDYSTIVQIKSQMKSPIFEFTIPRKGQMICFSTTKKFEDLIIATILKPIDDNKLLIKIVSKENIENIFNRDLIMIEPLNTHFERYLFGFDILRDLNEHNFPFKEKILWLDNNNKLPSYVDKSYSKNYTYQGHTFNFQDFQTWPKHEQLNLEEKQYEAIQKAATSDFTLIQGPPGCGKTFIGLEILSILLKNTKEKVFIVTQGNDALDKFLLGMKKKITTQKVARLGHQSKCEQIEDFIQNDNSDPEVTKYVAKLSHKYKKEKAKLLREKKDDQVFEKCCNFNQLKIEAWQLAHFINLQKKRIFGMTTAFATRNRALIQLLKPGILIFEEASEILESHVVATLTKNSKQIIMIGDHKQLQPFTNSRKLQKFNDFNVSLFERMVMQDISFTGLDVQRRMIPEISALVRMTIYPHLKDSIDVMNRENIRGMSHNLYCLNHTNPETADGTSFSNKFEAIKCGSLVKRLIKARYKPDDITILTPYKPQQKIIKEELNNISRNIRVAVLDTFQGEDSKIIILSLVRSNTKNEIGFLNMENRIAVTLSRAKDGFYIIGNMSCFANAVGKANKWATVLDYLNEKNLIGDSFPL